MNLEHQPLPVLEEGIKPKQGFLNDYRDANFLSKLSFQYAQPFINAINGNQSKIKEEMLLDMELKDGETDRTTKYF